MVIRTAPIGAVHETRDTPGVVEVKLADIKLDQRAQPRVALSPAQIQEYAEAMERGDKFPPMVVFRDGADYWLADGFHRFYAATQAKRTSFPCEVRPGGMRAAVLFSVGANAAHGLLRTADDKRRAVSTMLADPEWAAWSDNDIRKQCHVSLSFVQNLRKDPTYREVSYEILPPPPVPEAVQRRADEIKAAGGTPRFYKRGKTVAVMNVAGINADRRKQVENPAEEITTTAPAIGPLTIEGPIAFAVPPAPSRFDTMVALWCEASSEDREAFLAYLRINNQIGAGHADRAGAVTPPPVAVPARPIESQAKASEDNGSTTGGAGAVTGEASRQRQRRRDSGERPAPLSKADQARLLRPHCRHADNLDQCGGSGKRHCRTCLVAAGIEEAA